MSAALFAIVYGFAHAESDGWGNTVTIAFLVAGVGLLGVFFSIQQRVAHPLLPLRIILDRTRAGSFLAVFVTGAGMFAVFLFLTYYLQNTLGFTPITTGFAFMPMIFSLIVTATLSTAIVLPRFGPRVLMTTGLFVAALGMGLLTQIDVDSSYVTHILPGLIVMGLGLGATMAPAMQGAISGVDPGRLGCRVGDGQHDAAGRRFDRYRSAEHHRSQRGDRVRHRQHGNRDGSACAAGTRGDRQLHHDVLVGHRHLPARRGHLGDRRQAGSATRRARGCGRRRPLTGP